MDYDDGILRNFPVGPIRLRTTADTLRAAAIRDVVGSQRDIQAIRLETQRDITITLAQTRAATEITRLQTRRDVEVARINAQRDVKLASLAVSRETFAGHCLVGQQWVVSRPVGETEIEIDTSEGWDGWCSSKYRRRTRIRTR